MITRSVKGSLVLATGLVLAALTLTYASGQGWIDTDMDKRLVQALIGAILVLFGNAMGKRAPDEAARPEPHPGMSAARRFFGLALVLGVGVVDVFATTNLVDGLLEQLLAGARLAQQLAEAVLVV